MLIDVAISGDRNVIKKEAVKILKYKDLTAWVWNLVVDIERGKEAESVWEHGVEENIWTEVGRGNGGMEEIA